MISSSHNDSKSRANHSRMYQNKYYHSNVKETGVDDIISSIDNILIKNKEKSVIQNKDFHLVAPRKLFEDKLKPEIKNIKHNLPHPEKPQLKPIHDNYKSEPRQINYTPIIPEDNKIEFLNKDKISRFGNKFKKNEDVKFNLEFRESNQNMEKLKQMVMKERKNNHNKIQHNEQDSLYRKYLANKEDHCYIMPTNEIIDVATNISSMKIIGSNYKP
jgi:hypothetical protein